MSKLLRNKKINCNFLLYHVLSYNFSIPLAIIPKVTAQIPTMIPTPTQPSMNWLWPSINLFLLLNLFWSLMVEPSNIYIVKITF